MMNNLAQQIYQNAKDKGFYDNGQAKNVGERIALIHSELSEALEADRKNKYSNLKEFEERRCEILNSYQRGQLMGITNPDFETLFKSRIKDTFEDEMADVIIRCLDMCAHKGIDIEKHIELKMKYNSLREKMHGKKY